MHLYKPTENDYAELTRLWEASVRATHAFLSDADIVEIRGQLGGYFGGVELLALKGGDGRIAAFMGTDGNKLEMLFVHPDFFRQGLGKQLLNHAICELGVTGVDVNEDNPGAAEFYRRCGFVENGRDELDSAGRPFPILHLRLPINDGRPELFAASECNIWRDPYIQEQMLKCHLDPDSDAASRSPASIGRTIEFIAGEAGHRLLDLGCGPGLYTERLAAKGYQVTGIDFNRKAIEYAEKHSAGGVTYLHGDYIKSFPAGEFDSIIMIYCDMGTHSPASRDQLLRHCHRALAPGGKLIFDVFGTGITRDKHEGKSWSHSAGADFWAESEYLLLQQTFHYPAERVYAYQYNLIQQGRTKHFIVWEQYYTEEAITEVLRNAGFRQVTIRRDILEGNNFTSNAEMFIVAVK